MFFYRITVWEWHYIWEFEPANEFNSPKIAPYTNIYIFFLLILGWNTKYFQQTVFSWDAVVKIKDVLYHSLCGLQQTACSGGKEANTTVFTRVFPCLWCHTNQRLTQTQTDESKPKHFTTTPQAQIKTIPENNSYDTRYHDMILVIQYEWWFFDYK